MRPGHLLVLEASRAHERITPPVLWFEFLVFLLEQLLLSS